MEYLIHGFGLVLDPYNLMVILVGVLVGVIVGALPGLSSPMAVALSMLASISGRSSIRNLIAGAIGVLLGTVGVHLTSGVERFTFGVAELTDGIHFVPVLIGLFAVSELLGQSRAANVAYERITSVVVKLPSKADFLKVR